MEQVEVSFLTEEERAELLAYFDGYASRTAKERRDQLPKFIESLAWAELKTNRYTMLQAEMSKEKHEKELAEILTHPDECASFMVKELEERLYKSMASLIIYDTHPETKSFKKMVWITEYKK